MARRKINFYRSDTDDLYDDSYANYIYDVWLKYNAGEDKPGSDYECKHRFVQSLSCVYTAFDLQAIGYHQYFAMEYCREQNTDRSKHWPLSEFVLIWHDDIMKNCTVIVVDGDSLEAMQRDIMRAVMR